MDGRSGNILQQNGSQQMLKTSLLIMARKAQRFTDERQCVEYILYSLLGISPSV